LPKKIKKKICKRTVTRRLAEKGYRPEKKINKSDPGVALSGKRIAFARNYRNQPGSQRGGFLQAVADFKEFTYYPKELKPKFSKLRAPWTYMTKKEKRERREREGE
jgi:hypothetical protein